MYLISLHEVHEILKIVYVFLDYGLSECWVTLSTIESIYPCICRSDYDNSDIKYSAVTSSMSPTQPVFCRVRHGGVSSSLPPQCLFV